MDKELNLCGCEQRQMKFANEKLYNSLTVVSTKNGKRDWKQPLREFIFITSEQASKQTNKMNKNHTGVVPADA